MKIFTLLFLTLTLLFSACNNNAEKQLNSTQANIKTLIMPFSDSLKMDTFKVMLTGNQPKKMLLTFKIISFNGKEIFHKVLKASNLIDNYKETVDLTKEKSQHDFIMDEFTMFLDDENFLVPAITPNEKPDRQTKDKIFFEELKKSNLNGFKYRITKEKKIYIGWSRSANKVKVYYECC